MKRLGRSFCYCLLASLVITIMNVGHHQGLHASFLLVESSSTTTTWSQVPLLLTTLTQDRLTKRRKQRKEFTVKNLTTLNNGGFIHMAKTGGSTISLQLRNGCHSFVDHPCRTVANETIASRKISKYYHIPDFSRLQEPQEHDFWVISLRDPLDRTTSSFVYVHPRNLAARGEFSNLRRELKLQTKFLYRCYPTLESFATYVGDHPRQYKLPIPMHGRATARHCRHLARAMLQSQVRISPFFFFGYQTILKYMKHGQNTKPRLLERHRRKEPVFLAIRQPHLVEDFRSVNLLLGQDPQSLDLVQDKVRDMSNQTLPVHRSLSPLGQANLCRALEGEYRAYVWFLERARNLSGDDVRQAREYAAQQCPQLSHLWETMPTNGGGGAHDGMSHDRLTTE